VLGQPEGADKYDIHVEAFMAQPDASRLYQLAHDVARHEFSIPIDRTMKLQEIQEAHRIFERGGLAGKIVLVPDQTVTRPLKLRESMLVKKGSPSAAASSLLSTPTFLLFNWSASIPFDQRRALRPPHPLISTPHDNVSSARLATVL
jgi:hypothetical protein